MKLLTIVGARPQFVKAAALSRSIAAHPDIHEVLVHTGQHFDKNMSEVFFDQLSIPRPAYNLGIGGSTHGAMTGRQIEGLEAVLLSERPDCVVVYGDTNSTLAGAIAASKLNIPIAHVEAGLRSFNRRMPEEVNRVLTDHVSTFLFAPGEASRRNMLAEGIDESAIHVVGDIMVEAANYYRDSEDFDRWAIGGLEPGSFVLCTLHRAENTDSESRLRRIMAGLAESDLPVVLPLHPRTRRTLAEVGVLLPPKVTAIEPVGYREMMWLEANCEIVVTDSGGVQKEAYFHGKRCVVLRDETEWVELVELGINRLVGADQGAISNALNNPWIAQFPADVYGDGRTSLLILERLERM